MWGNLDLNQGPTGYESHSWYHSERQRLNQNSIFIGKGIEHLFRLMLEISIRFRSFAEKMRKNLIFSNRVSDRNRGYFLSAEESSKAVPHGNSIL